jgi:hypothetical protein
MESGTPELALRTEIVRYLSGGTSIDDLRQWVTTEGWDIGNRVGPDTAALFHDVELLLAEHAHGDWTEREVRERLTPLVTTYMIHGAEVRASTVVPTVRLQVTAGGLVPA